MSDSSKSVFERKVFAKDKIIIRAGDPGEEAYLIQSGLVEVYVTRKDQHVSLAKLEAGQIFGEMSLLDGSKRNANVRALENTNLIVISQKAFHNKLNKSDPTMKAIIQMLGDRVLTNNRDEVGRKTDRHKMLTGIQEIQQNMLASLSQTRQKSFEETVSPKFDDLIKAIREFNDRV